MFNRLCTIFCVSISYLIMNIKIWIGKDIKLRKKVLAMFDIEKFGGKPYFRNCTEIYVFNKNGYDIRCNKDNNRTLFNSHKNKEVCIN